MSTIKQLIEETKANCESLNEQIKEFDEIIEELREAFSRTRFNDHAGKDVTYKLAISYYPSAFDGRKVCFSVGGTKELHEQMIIDLITSNNMEKFLDYFTKTALPIFQRGTGSVRNFYF